MCTVNRNINELLTQSTWLEYYAQTLLQVTRLLEDETTRTTVYISRRESGYDHVTDTRLTLQPFQRLHDNRK